MTNQPCQYPLEKKGPIGVFDSGYGGLTILEKIRKFMPQYDYIYLGDNARAPYGNRSFDVVYEFTREQTERLISMNCPLVIYACNTASAKALRSVQMNDLPRWCPDRRVLGIIRPTAEYIGTVTQTKHVGVFGTVGTYKSNSYPLEIHKFFPDLVVTCQPCPLWVPIVENKEYDSDGADYFVKKYIDQLMEADPEIDAVIIGCTHYPLLFKKIEKYLPKHVTPVLQGDIVANSLIDYLKRHTDLECMLTQNGTCRYFTTEAVDTFQQNASIFLHETVTAQCIRI